jgi:hypothetical protein
MTIKINKKNWIRIGLIFIPILFLAWIFLSLLFVNRISFSLITLSSDIDSTIDKDFFRGTFESSTNNLGLAIFSTRSSFNSKNKENFITFKIRELGDRAWLYETNYSSKLFDSQSEFSFGFPPIKESNGKKYEYEISAEDISIGEIIDINKKHISTGHKYTVSELKNLDSGINFVTNKFKSIATDRNLIAESFIYLLPLVLFLILWLLALNTLRNKSYIEFKMTNRQLKLIVILLLIRILLPNNSQLDMLLISSITWILIVYNLDLKSKVSFIFCLIILLTWLLFLPFGYHGIQRIFNSLGYVLFVFGIIQLIFEERSEFEKKKA